MKIFEQYPKDLKESDIWKNLKYVSGANVQNFHQLFIIKIAKKIQNLIEFETVTDELKKYFISP